MFRYMDSFSHYTTITQKWASTTGSPSIVGSGGRFSGDSLKLDYSSAHATSVTRSFGTAQQTWIVGCAVKPGTITGQIQSLFSLMDSGTAQLELQIDSNGHLVLRRGAGGTVLATGTTTLSAGVWVYIEIKAKIDPSTGTYEIRLNGSSSAEFSGSGANTRSTSNSTADGLRFGRNDDYANTTAQPQFCDLYVYDDQGSANNDFAGDTRIEYRAPDGNGNSSQFTGSDGNSTDNYLLVDEHPPNDDTDYVEDSTVGDKDTYTFQNASVTSGSVHGVQIGLWAKKTDAGLRSVRSLARLSGTETDNGADEVLGASYQYLLDIRETKPGGGSWTVTDFNNSEFGMKVAA